SRRKLRKHVPSIDPEGKRPCPQHGSERQFGVKMRKQITVARKLPFQRIAQRIGIDRNQHQIVSPRKILRRGRADLRGGGEMDEAVAGIDGSAAEHAGMPRLVPKYIFADLVNRRRHGAPDSAAGFDVSEINPARQCARSVNSDWAADLKRGSAPDRALRSLYQRLR